MTRSTRGLSVTAELLLVCAMELTLEIHVHAFLYRNYKIGSHHKIYD